MTNAVRETSMLSFLGRRLRDYLAAVATAYVLAAVTATQSVVRSLQGMGVPVPPGERLAMTAQDLAGMAGSLLPLIALGLLIAFIVAALLCRWLPGWRVPLYLLAGAAATVTIHLALELAMGITPFPIARTWGGLAIQAAAGAGGGALYLYLLKRRATRLG
jgi:hypothetical protein